jgi:hypothetical protein
MQFPSVGVAQGHVEAAVAEPRGDGLVGAVDAVRPMWVERPLFGGLLGCVSWIKVCVDQASLVAR